jgi:hypothetical protein
MSLLSKLEGIAHLHARRMTALHLAEQYPERGREFLAEWAGLSFAEDHSTVLYSPDPKLQAHFERGLEDGRMILFVHGIKEMVSA